MVAKKIAGGLILIIGVGAFIVKIFNNDLNFALIYLMTTLIFWILYELIFDTFDWRFFTGAISVAGFLVAFSIFFMFGIEEVPYPIGAIVFHSGGFAGALGIGFFSFLPILIFYQTSNLNAMKKSKVNHQVSNNEPEPVIFSKDWEIASDNDLQSDEFEME